MQNNAPFLDGGPNERRADNMRPSVKCITTTFGALRSPWQVLIRRPKDIAIIPMHPLFKATESVLRFSRP